MLRRGPTFAITAFAIVAVAASCEEHLPAPLDGASVPADIPDAVADASADVEADAAVTDGAVADAPGSGACNVRLAAPEIVASPHVPEGTAVAYTSNPPSSGPHYGAWANFQEFTHPVADGYLVHAMEHGAVLLLYDCVDDGGTCADMIAELRAVREAVPTDPLCDPGVRVRVILAPRSANDTVVTAAAWGNTYRADCVDAPSLAAFINAHYAQGPENFCSPGSIF